MNVARRLLRKPASTLLWTALTALMTAFLIFAFSLWFSSARLSEALDRSHTAIAVRTDPGMNKRKTENGVEWVIDKRSFTEADAACFSSMDSVTAVRNHTLSAASSASFHPIVGLNKDLSWVTNGTMQPYNHTVVCGTVTRIASLDSKLCLVMKPEAFLLVPEEYEVAAGIVEYVREFSVEFDLSAAPELKDYFRTGERYVICGAFCPVDYGSMYGEHVNLTSRMVNYLILPGRVSEEDGMLMGHLPIYPSDLPDGALYEPYSFPAAEALTGDAASFFEDTPHEIWREYRETWEKQQHSLPVIGTEHLESVFLFLTGDAEIIDGRSFTEEEYETGAKSVILSEAIVKRAGLSVGDSITIRQYLCEGDPVLDTNESTMPRGGRRSGTSILAVSGASLNNPSIDMLNMQTAYGPEEAFTLVGVYRLTSDWSRKTYAFTPNTVFIPRAAQIDGAFARIPAEGGPDIYGIYLSIELKNGHVDEFQTALADSPYAGQFYTYDQGFEAVQRNINGLSLTSLRLFVIAAFGWILFLILFLLLYQAAQRRTLGTMRSLGMRPPGTARYLFLSGGGVAAAGVAVGTILSAVALRFIQNRILSDMLSEIDRSALSGKLPVSEEALAEMVHASSPALSALILLGVCQLVLIAILLWVQAYRLSKKLPRVLMGV